MLQHLSVGKKLRRVFVCVLSVSVICLTACGGDNPTDAKIDPGDTIKPPPDVQRAALAVTVRVTTEDQAVSQQLGWSGGVVPGATVVVQRRGSTGADTAIGDQNGVARFDGLLEGEYAVSALRLLSAAETASLTGDNVGAGVFGGASTATVRAPAASAQVETAAGRRGSIIVSEVLFAAFNYPGIGTYLHHRYIELYNNSDSTVFLDGKLIGAAWARSVNAGAYPCTNYIEFLQDPAGLWGRYLYRVPGGGRDHAVAPGATVLLATDAIDHRQFVPEAFDLSRADFEFLGRNDVDNPSVANLLSVGPEIDALDHGSISNSIELVLFVAEGLDASALTRRTASLPPGPGVTLALIPADAILDAVSFVWVGGLAVCPQLAPTNIDRQTLGWIEADNPLYWRLTPQRPVLAVLPNGRKVLQRTRTTARDFQIFAGTPGTIP